MSLLTPVKPYLKYSIELEEADKVMSYFTKLYAVQTGFNLCKAAQGPEVQTAKTYLMSELDSLEKMKREALQGTRMEEFQAHVDNFCLSMFARVDKEERTCLAITKQNAIDFNRAGHFIQVLSVFGALEPEWEERAKYCKYKAGTILKALKEGRQPDRGNPNDPPEEAKQEPFFQEPDLSTGIYQPALLMPHHNPTQPSMPPAEPAWAQPPAYTPPAYTPPAYTPPAYTPPAYTPPQPAPVASYPSHPAQPPVNPYNGQKTTFKKDPAYYKTVAAAK